MKPYSSYDYHLKERRKAQRRHYKPDSMDGIAFTFFAILIAVCMFITTMGCTEKNETFVAMPKAVKQQISDLQGQVTGLQSQIDALQVQLNNTDNNAILEATFVAGQIAALQASMAALIAQQTGDESLIANLQAQINLLQASNATLLATIATLQGYTQIVDVVDPCGDSAGYDEVLLKLSNGKYLAHFSSGNLQFLTELVENVSYRTTDQFPCYFHISGGNIVY